MQTRQACPACAVYCCANPPVNSYAHSAKQRRGTARCGSRRDSILLINMRLNIMRRRCARLDGPGLIRCLNDEECCVATVARHPPNARTDSRTRHTAGRRYNRVFGAHLRGAGAGVAGHGAAEKLRRALKNTQTETVVSELWRTRHFRSPVDPRSVRARVAPWNDDWRLGWLCYMG